MNNLLLLTRQLRIFYSILLFSFVTANTFAGGFQLSDHSVTALGRAQAGYGIVGDDLSAAHFNPAGLTLFKTRQFQVGAAIHRSEWHFTDTGSTVTGDDAHIIKASSTPHAFMVIPINSKLSFGWASTAPFGSNTLYNDAFIGRFQAQQTKVKSINANPSLSYQFNDNVSLGMGLYYQQFETILSNTVVGNSVLRIEGDSRATGFNLGTMVTFSNQSRLGVSYRSKVTHDISGHSTFSGFVAGNGTFPTTAKIILPESAYLAYTIPTSDQLRWSLGYRWTRWSRYRQIDVETPTATITSLRQIPIIANWENSNTFTLGVDYQINDQWTWRAGFAYDQTPIPDVNHTVRNIDGDKQWYSIGATYKLNQSAQWDFAYRYVDVENQDINQSVISGTQSLIGTLGDLNAHSLAIQYKQRF